MVRVKRGEGGTRPAIFSVDDRLSATLDRATNRTKKKWDYFAIVAGLPGAGKSTFAQMCAKYVCEWFDETYVCFTADEFIRITNECPRYSAIILDEAFESLNTKIGMNPEFIRIVNHMQIIRQKNLYIFICLPNFFDLSKSVAVFRASNLFVTYGDDDDNKGYFLAFGRDEKRELYVKGGKFMNYNAVRANFHGRFGVPHIIPDDLYEEMKRKHMMDAMPKKKESKEHFNKKVIVIERTVLKLKVEKKFTTKEIMDITGLADTTIYEILNRLGWKDNENLKLLPQIALRMPQNPKIGA